MSLSTNIRTYEDIKFVLDAALDEGGGKYQLVSKSAAWKWRQRAYQFRKLITKTGSSSYDRLVLIIDPKKPEEIRILLRQLEGKFTAEDGTVVDLATDFAQSNEAAIQKQAKDLMDSIVLPPKKKK